MEKNYFVFCMEENCTDTDSKQTSIVWAVKSIWFLSAAMRVGRKLTVCACVHVSCVPPSHVFGAFLNKTLYVFMASVAL